MTKSCPTYYCDFHCCSMNSCHIEYLIGEIDEYSRAEACVIGTEWYRKALENPHGDVESERRKKI